MSDVPVSSTSQGSVSPAIPAPHPMDIYIVNEHEPDHSQYPCIVVAVFSTPEAAQRCIERLEAERDEDGFRSAEERYWDCEVRTLDQEAV